MSKRSRKREPQTVALDAPARRAPVERQFLLAGIMLTVAVLVIYGRAAAYPLIHLDDDRYLSNIYTQQGLTWEGIRWAFFGTTPPYWHPMTWLSHMLDADIFGAGVTGGPHVVNFVLHAVNAILVLVVLNRLTGKFAASAVVALLFAVHPLRVESVVWLAERKDVLCTLFTLLTIWAYAAYAARPFHWGRYALVVLVCACAVMSKPMAVTLPFVLLLLDWWPLQRICPLLPRVAEKLPLLALAGLTAKGVLNSSALRESGNVAGLTFGAQVANAIVSYPRYLWATLWPHPLALIYPYSISISATTVAASSLVILAITGVSIHQRIRRPYLLFGWLWFLGMLVPVIGLVQSGLQARADRFTYLPHIGLLLAVIWLASDCIDCLQSRGGYSAQTGLARNAFVAAVAVAFAAVSWTRVGEWSDPFTLYAHDLQRTGDNPRLELQYGIVLFGAGRAAEAEASFRKILASNSQANAARLGLANSLGAQQRYAEAATTFRDVLAVEPEQVEAHVGLGIAEMNLVSKQYGRDGTKVKDSAGEDAVAHFNEALRLGLPPARAAQVHSNLGVLMKGEGKMKEAFSHFQSAIALDFHLMSAHRNIALALIENDRPSDAGEYLDRTIQALGPDPVLVRLRDSLKPPAN